MTWESQKEKIKKLSEHIVKWQKPVQILNSIKPDPLTIAKFKASKYRKIPKVKPDYYQSIKLGFDPRKKETELKHLHSELKLILSPGDPLLELLDKILDGYRLVLGLIKNRGTQKFYDYSHKLYGSPRDSMMSDKNTVFDMSKLLYSILSGIKKSLPVPNSEKIWTAERGVAELNTRMQNYFGEGIVTAVVSDGIVADAAAGADKVKLKADAMFSPREIDIYEVHEGWVHVGTTINGRLQPVAKWLSVGPPRVTATQEGLAVLMEIFTFRSSVKRAQRINDRIMCIAKAEEGANLIDIFEYFRTEGYEEDECLHNAFRVFRGSPLEGGAPLTKDISYCKGFVENYNFMRSAIRANKPNLLPFLFAGKIHVEDIPLLYHLYQEGIVEYPKHLPPHFKDVNGIAVWMSFSSFFNKVDLKNVQAHYNNLFKRFL